MTTIIDLTAELAKLTMLRGRTPQSTSADRVGTSAQLALYRDGVLFTSKFSGKGAWERHMKGDELVHILDGAATLDIVTGDGPPQSLPVRAGMVAIVPQGAWHRFPIAGRRDIDDHHTAADRPHQARCRRSAQG